jgi:hypothetical protein
MWVKDKKLNDCHCLGGDVLIGGRCTAGQSREVISGQLVGENHLSCCSAVSLKVQLSFVK